MNTVIFKCKRSGNTVSFTKEGDIDAMRKHEGYEEVKNAETPKTIEAEPQQASTQEVLKKRSGKPPKVPSFLQD